MKFTTLKFKNLKNDRTKYYDWFLTFPNWDKFGTGPEYCKLLSKRLPPFKWMIGCHEYHDNGNSHFHMSGVFEHKHNVKTWLDYAKKAWPEDYKRIDFRKTLADDYGRNYFLKENPPEFIYESGIQPVKDLNKVSPVDGPCSQEDWNRWTYAKGEWRYLTIEDKEQLFYRKEEDGCDITRSYRRYWKELTKRAYEQGFLYDKKRDKWFPN